MPKAKRTTPTLTDTMGLDTGLDLRTKDAKKLTRFLKQDEAEQFDSVRKNLSLLNYYLSNQAIEIAKGNDSAGLRDLVQLCTAFGISYDKMYSKRDPGIRPLSFPEPLLKMVKKGLELSNSVASRQSPEVSVVRVPEVSVDKDGEARDERSAEFIGPPSPPVRSRYKTPVLQSLHEALYPDLPVKKSLGINPRAAYRKQWEEKRKQKALTENTVSLTTEVERDSAQCGVSPQGFSVGGEACAGQEAGGGGLSPGAVA